VFVVASEVAGPQTCPAACAPPDKRVCVAKTLINFSFSPVKVVFHPQLWQPCSNQSLQKMVGYSYSASRHHIGHTIVEQSDNK